MFKEYPYRSIILWGLLISCLMSLLLIASDDTINNDGIVHVGAARLIAEGQWQAAIQVTGWPPVYQATIAYVHLWTGLSLENSAHAFSLFTYLLLVAAFIACMSELTQNKRIIWLGLLVVLLNADINGIRVDIYKDSAYWAGYLSALWFILRFVKTQQWRAVLGWNVAITLASMYRFEGMAFALLLPLVIFVLPQMDGKTRFKAGLKLYMPIVVVVIGIAIALLVGAMDVKQLGRFTYPVEMFSALLDDHSLFGQTVLKVRGMVGVGHYSAYVLVFIMLSFMILLKLFKSMGLAFTFLTFLWCRNRRDDVSQQHLLVIYAAIGINLIILILYSVGYFFLQARYTTALSLTIMLLLPFVLDDLIEQWQQRRTKWIKASVIFIAIWFTYMAIDSLTTFGASKKYIREAGEWLAETKQAKQSLFVNDEIVLYYSGAKMTAHATVQWPHLLEELEEDQVQQYDIIALRVRKKYANRLAIVEQYLGKPDKVFYNEINDRVMIFIKE